jgi:1-deoxy-D-xylulose-5-phosphate synthase
MGKGTGLIKLKEELPGHFHDVGIAEQHAVTFSAGLATQGLIPFCNIYSTFMQRAYDQVIHDVCIQELPVIFCLDRAGFAGADGPTHHGAYDLAYMRCIPNLIVSAPMNEAELRNLMYSATLDNSPYSIRYPRGKGVMTEWKTEMEYIKPGTGRIIQEGSDIAILTIGHMGNYAVKAAEILNSEGINPGIFDMRFVKPLDEKLLSHVAQNYNYIITVEDGCVMGGFGSAVLEYLADKEHNVKVKRLGIPDRIVEHGTQMELHKECGFDPDGIANAVLEMMQKSIIHS